MKTKQAMKGLGLAAGLLFAVVPFAAQAAATAANTTVTNNVSLDFKVNNTAQTTQTTNASFKVDEKIVLSVANMEAGDDSTTNTQPNSTKAAIHFQVTNNSNGSTQVLLTPTTSDASVSSPALYTDAACTSALTSPLTMAAAAVQDVYVCSTIAGTATDGSNLNIGLKTQVGDGSGNPLTTDDSGVDKNANTTNLNTEYKIFADAANGGAVANGDPNTPKDGITSSGGNYTVKAASLSLSKVVKVLQDAFCYDASLPVGQRTAPVQCGTVGNPASAHALPGALVQYTVTVANASGAQNATALDIKDTLDGNTVYKANSMTVNGTSCNDVAPGNTVTITGASSSTATCNNAGNSLEVSGFTVGAGETVTIVYQATLN